MTRLLRLIVLVVCVSWFASMAVAQTATNTPTATSTSTPTNTSTATNTSTPTPTSTPTVNPGQPVWTPALLSAARVTHLKYPRVPSLEVARGNILDLAVQGLRAVPILGTDATALGLRDVGSVAAILAFTASSGAGATKTLLVAGTDYTVANGDVTLVTDQSANLLIIFYRPK